jgi:hypothetical protein
LRAARTDFRLLSEISRTLSTPFEDVPALLIAQIEKAKTLEKTCLRLSGEFARREGGELDAATAAGQGIRRVTWGQSTMPFARARKRLSRAARRFFWP